MDLDAVRTFVAVADAGQFQHAAAALSLTQQAVSKRVAALEKDLGVRLFLRTPRGAQLTIDGQAFLPHARELLAAEERAVGSVQPGRRALRVDVISRRIGPAALLRDFHRAHPDAELDVVTLFDAPTAIAAVAAGTIDATFRAVLAPRHELPGGIATARVYDEPMQLLTGPGHALASARSVALAELADHRIWMPGIAPGTEWGAYYEALASAFDLRIDAIGPNFGTETLFDALAESTDLATFVSERSRLLWPAEHDLRIVPLRDPIPVYPHSLVWRADNAHPVLALLREQLDSAPASGDGGATWQPDWAAPSHDRGSYRQGLRPVTTRR